MDRLKPCPFCGREVRLINVSPFALDSDMWLVRHCEQEPVCFLWHNEGYCGKKKVIIRLWNQRDKPKE